jgi:S-adenosylmethionine synthetase
MKKLFTSESVTSGHPDKLCDYISDNLLDEFMKKDKKSRCGIECVAGKDTIFITGEVTSKTKVDVEKVVRKAIKSIGYLGDNDIDYKTCKIINNLGTQSPDIALGVDKSVEEKNGELISEGAGDQGIMFGYASNETKEYMPLAISLAHKLAKRLEEVRKENIIKGLAPDGKTEVTVLYDDDKPIKVTSVVVSTSHIKEKNQDELKEEILDKVIKEVIPKKYLDNDTKYYINPTGRFVISGPKGDSGLTGRKVIVDTYGGYAPHGGGCFSGKDPTKVDRSASYMARFLSKNIVANKYADKCLIELSYVIGKAKPISIFVDTYGTNKISEDEIINKIENNFDLTPRGIINYLNLENIKYVDTTNYGHFGKENMPWEKIIKL